MLDEARGGSVTTCSHLTAAKRGEIPADGAYDYVELALDRLLARRAAARARG